MWYYVYNNLIIYFDEMCQEFITKCFKNKQPYCCLKRKDLDYNFYGSIMYIEFKNMKIFWENDIFNTVKLFFNDEFEIVKKYIVANYVPSCSITKSHFPLYPNLKSNILVNCPHKYNCHDRFCKVHNYEHIGQNFPFSKNKHDYHLTYVTYINKNIIFD